ncbi:hypothetical protein [Bartonella apis]|uniref:hypothetical protein n=1 Tax=Bartonella apis TaxID=1686310 RepID=UPI00243333DD|nr:hypothetical protein [Bartonella apis]
MKDNIEEPNSATGTQHEQIDTDKEVITHTIKRSQLSNLSITDLASMCRALSRIYEMMTAVTCIPSVTASENHSNGILEDLSDHVARVLGLSVSALTKNEPLTAADAENRARTIICYDLDMIGERLENVSVTYAGIIADISAMNKCALYGREYDPKKHSIKYCSEVDL